MLSLDDAFYTKRKYIITAVILLGCLGIFIYFMFKSNDIESNDLKSYNSLGIQNDKPTEQGKVKKIVVDVKGAIQKPGVYEFTEGTRAHQVIAKAGGLTAGADTTALNLAQIISDGSILYVPKQGEVHPPTANNPQNNKVNINTATLDEIEKLEGIGPAKAKAILSYREEHGLFRDIKDLRKVSGIGEKLYKRISDKISV